MAIASVTCKNCGNDLWEDRLDGFLRCTNCSEKRPYIRRQKRDDIVTPSQEKMVKQIKRFFDGSRFSMDAQPTTKITKFETELQEGTGLLYVRIKTGDSISQEGGYFAIGRRGALKVLSSYGLNDNKQTMKHYAKILGGKIRS